MTGRRRAQWRDYQTAAGGRPVREFLLGLPEDDRAEVLAAMKEVALLGKVAARHLRGEIYEVRADTDDHWYRVLFAAEGRFSHVLLALEGFEKKTRTTPKAEIALAERRLADWRSRGSSIRNKKK